MGIIRLRHRGPGEDDSALHSSLTIDEFLQDERNLLLPNDHANAPDDDSELSDTGCEYALVNGNFCSVPYELFELSNLKEILSLETWNLCLTEEERFRLTAYLPDMDQETFNLTMSDLLGGANFFFGSPLETLFHRFRGGFYSVEVSQFREGLKLLHQQLYYHSLRSYHERMAQKITQMRETWSDCLPNASVQERVQSLNNKNRQKPLLLVDLNAVPVEEELSSETEKRITGGINNEVSTHVDCSDKVSNRTKAKGVLKIKPLEMNSTSEIHTVFPFCTEPHESFKRPPTGVLKIKPKGCTTTMAEKPSDESRNIGSRQLDDGRSHLTKMTGAKGVRMLCDGRIGNCFGGQHSKVPCTSSAGLYQLDPDKHLRKIMQAHTMSDAASRNSDAVMDDYQLFSRYCDRMFPVAYKRKKPYTKHSAVVQSFRQPSMEPLTPTAADLHRVEKAKSMKIRAKR